jgi:acyl carrier protein
MDQKFVEALNKINSEILENPGIDLVQEGIVDSLCVMNLITELEKVFGIDFDPYDVMPENFSSGETLWKLVQKYLVEKR